MITKRIGYERADEILKIFGNQIQDFLREDEIASRNYADRFLALLNVKTDQGIHRVKLLEQKLKNCLYPYDVKLLLTLGVYCLKKEDNKISTPIVYSRFAHSTIRMGHIDLKNVAFYDEAIFEQQKREMDLEKMAPDALKKKQFVVYYQLKHGVHSKQKWLGVEALVRWNNEQYGFLMPGEFIELFEKNGFIVRLDRYVFETVCKDLRYCLDRNYPVLPVGVNLSKCDIEVDHFLNEYENILEKYQIPRELIEFELTETMTIENESVIQEVIDKIHAMGCLCSLDDFGSGYSSIKMVKDYKFDVVKLDSSLFRGQTGFTESSKLIVETMIRLSHKLGMKVVAEGIEYKEQVDFLTKCQCDSIQGFYYSRPMPFEQIIEEIKK